MALGTTSCSVVVCICIVNLMIVCEAPRELLCGTSPPHEAAVKHEIMGEAQISHDDGKEQLQAVYVEQQRPGRSTSVLADSICKCVHICSCRRSEVHLTSCLVAIYVTQKRTIQDRITRQK